MRVFLDSFQHYGPASNNTEQIAASAFLPKKWTAVEFCKVTDAGPNGGYACQLGRIARSVPANVSYAVDWKFKIDVSGSFGTGQICQFSAVSTSHLLTALMTLQLESDGRLSFYAGNVYCGSTSGGDALHAGTWYTLEVNCTTGVNVGTGLVTIVAYLRVNGVQLLTSGLGGSDIPGSSLLSGNANINQISFGSSGLGQSTIAVPVIYDDLLDFGAAYNITSHQLISGPVMWLGDCKIGVIFPNGDVVAQWTSTGANQWSQINSNPVDLAKFVSSSTVGQKDALNWQDAAALPILTLQYSLYCNKNDAGTRELTFRSGAASAETIGPLVSMSDDPIYNIGGRDNDPATGDQWTKSTFDAKQFGFYLEV